MSEPEPESSVLPEPEWAQAVELVQGLESVPVGEPEREPVPEWAQTVELVQEQGLEPVPVDELEPVRVPSERGRGRDAECSVRDWEHDVTSPARVPCLWRTRLLRSD